MYGGTFSVALRGSKWCFRGIGGFSAPQSNYCATLCLYTYLLCYSLYPLSTLYLSPYLLPIYMSMSLYTLYIYVYIYLCLCLYILSLYVVFTKIFFLLFFAFNKKNAWLFLLLSLHSIHTTEQKKVQKNENNTRNKMAKSDGPKGKNNFCKNNLGKRHEWDRLYETDSNSGKKKCIKYNKEF